VNGAVLTVDADADTPMLWVLREELGLVGTKYGCGIGQCGACTIHVDGQAARACLLPLEQAVDVKIMTIESLGGEHPVQKAWIARGVPQCGYCQSGQIMAAVALLAAVPEPDDEAIDSAMAGNICRCGTYARIRQAIADAAAAGRRT